MCLMNTKKDDISGTWYDPTNQTLKWQHDLFYERNENGKYTIANKKNFIYFLFSSLLYTGYPVVSG